jgi:hypothetical protein
MTVFFLDYVHKFMVISVGILNGLERKSKCIFYVKCIFSKALSSLDNFQKYGTTREARSGQFKNMAPHSCGLSA